MQTCSVVFADLVGSEHADPSMSRISDVLDRVAAHPQNTIYQNDWGDAIVAIFESTADALRYALTLRDRLRHHDWAADGMLKPPMLRTAVTVGELQKRFDSIQKRDVPEGDAIVAAARIEPVTGPGEVRVTAAVAAVAGTREFHFVNLGQQRLPKKSGEITLFLAGWKSEQQALDERRHGPLLDSQYYRRAGAFRRFAFLWLLLDQLPRGSWGRSVPLWMREVWRDVPSIAPHPLMDEEGGFETTILNLEILARITGAEALLGNVGHAAIEYLKSRQDARGMGTLAASRHGYWIEPHARHTALGGWLFGCVLKAQTLASPDLQAVFRMSIEALFGDRPEKTTALLEDDRNPLLLYTAASRIVAEIERAEWRELIPAKHLKRYQANWKKASKPLIKRALDRTYDAVPERIGRRLVSPMTVPYGGFMRMETYSLLTAAALAHDQLDDSVKQRLAHGVEFVAGHYLKAWPAHVRYKQVERLQPEHASPLPYYAEPEETHPDLGAAAMLLRVMRSKELLRILWKNEVPESFGLARLYLAEDLTQLFDRYLADPALFALTHPGMLCAALVEDAPNLHEEVVAAAERSGLVTASPPVDLSRTTLDKVLSERRIDSLVEDVIGIDGEEGKIQLASHSITRLLVHRLRPGRYASDRLTPDDVKSIARRTLDVYRQPVFVNRFVATWGDQAERLLFEPFLRDLEPGSSILDLGCGPGQYALEFAQAGHRVTLVDGSAVCLEHARRKLVGIDAEFIEGDVLDAGFREGFAAGRTFDAIWISGLFAHVPRSEWPVVVEWLAAVVREGGRLFVNVSIENTSLFARDGRYFQYVPRAADLEHVLTRSGFRLGHVLQRAISRNTYREPLVEVQWANFYATRPVQQKTPIGELAATLTALAYDRAAVAFREVHIDGERQRTIGQRLDLLAELTGRRDDLAMLDAGCGPGDYVLAAAARGWRAFGIDISEATLDLARANCPERLRDRATFVLGDMRHLPDEWQEWFDGILCVTAMQHVPVADGEAVRVLTGFARALKPGGILRIDAQLGRGTGFDPDLRFLQGFREPDQVIALLAEAGLTFVKANDWILPSGRNAYRRPIEVHFMEFWTRKA